jgi:hypothetical protein
MTLIVVLLGITISGYVKLGWDASHHSREKDFTWRGFQSHNADIVRTTMWYPYDS